MTELARVAIDKSIRLRPARGDGRAVQTNTYRADNKTQGPTLLTKLAEWRVAALQGKRPANVAVRAMQTSQYSGEDQTF